jgi:hypothetical protein
MRGTVFLGSSARREHENDRAPPRIATRTAWSHRLRVADVTVTLQDDSLAPIARRARRCRDLVRPVAFATFIDDGYSMYEAVCLAALLHP